MSRSTLMWTRIAALPLWMTAVVTGCNGNGEDPPVCPPIGASFRLQVTAGTGEPLPDNTTLTVRYQGNVTESYKLGSIPNNEDVCCRPAAAAKRKLPSVSCDSSSSPDASITEVEAIHCELWTEGQAELTIRARGFAERMETLQALDAEDACTHQTLDIHIVLAVPEAGGS